MLLLISIVLLTACSEEEEKIVADPLNVATLIDCQTDDLSTKVFYELNEEFEGEIEIEEKITDEDLIVLSYLVAEYYLKNDTTTCPLSENGSVNLYYESGTGTHNDVFINTTNKEASLEIIASEEDKNVVSVGKVFDNQNQEIVDEIATETGYDYSVYRKTHEHIEGETEIDASLIGAY